MKKILFILAVIFWLALPALAEPRDTYHSAWQLIRETASEDGADFSTVYDLTLKGNFANKDSSTVANGGPFQIRSYESGVSTATDWKSDKWMFVICAENFDVGNDNTIDNTFSFNVVGWAKNNGMIQNLAEGDGILGTQAVILYPDDSANAFGALVDESSVAYDHGTESFTVTNEAFADVNVGMMAYITSDNDSNLTTGYYAITDYNDTNNAKFTGITSSSDTTARVQINPAFWTDTIVIDEKTKWPRVSDVNNHSVYNSGDNEVAFLVLETKGLEWIQFVVYDANGLGGDDEVGNVTVYGRKFQD